MSSLSQRLTAVTVAIGTIQDGISILLSLSQRLTAVTVAIGVPLSEMLVLPTFSQRLTAVTVAIGLEDAVGRLDPSTTSVVF